MQHVNRFPSVSKEETIFYRFGFLLIAMSKPQGQGFGENLHLSSDTKLWAVLLIFEHGLMKYGAWDGWHF